MKNQNDLIVIGVCVFLSIVAALCMFFMKREPAAIAPPQTVVTTAPAYPTNTQPVMAAGLSGGSNTAGSGMGGFGGGMGGMMGGPMGGPMGGAGGAAGGFHKPFGGAAGGMGRPGGK